MILRCILSVYAFTNTKCSIWHNIYCNCVFKSIQMTVMPKNYWQRQEKKLHKIGPPLRLVPVFSSRHPSVCVLLQDEVKFLNDKINERLADVENCLQIGKKEWSCLIFSKFIFHQFYLIFNVFIQEFLNYKIGNEKYGKNHILEQFKFTKDIN